MFDPFLGRGFESVLSLELQALYFLVDLLIASFCVRYGCRYYF
jgi:hypothetical protein